MKSETRIIPVGKRKVGIFLFLFVPKIQKHQSDQEGHDDQYVDRDACSLSGALLPCVSIFGHIRELSITRFVEEEVGEVGGGGHFFLLVLFFLSLMSESKRRRAVRHASDGRSVEDSEKYVNRVWSEKRCEVCLWMGRLLYCSRCCLAHYCSRGCQRAHWCVHKRECVK